MKYVKPEMLSLKGHAELDERWVQERIAEDPSILGLGELILKDKERVQPRAGRLDLLLQDPEERQRYEVEIQLGSTDESHLIRTIEYWDVERKRYSQYDHTAVMVAEDITSRFLNVISLFNGTIPLMALQIRAIKIGDQVSLLCTTVLDYVPRGLVDDDEEAYEVTDRAYWERRSSAVTLAMADEMLDLVKAVDPNLEPKYNKFYIGLAKAGKPLNFTVLKPKKVFLRCEVRLKRSPEIEEQLAAAGIDTIGYDARWGNYMLRLVKGDVKKHGELLGSLVRQAYTEFTS